MRSQPVDVVRRFLKTPACKTALSTMVAKNATIVAADGVLPQTEFLLPGRDAPEQQLLDTAIALLHCSATRRVDVISMFGAGGNVAAFGTITEVGKSGEDATSPFSLWVKVANGRIAYMQYLDANMTASAPKSEL